MEAGSVIAAVTQSGGREGSRRSCKRGGSERACRARGGEGLSAPQRRLDKALFGAGFKACTAMRIHIKGCEPRPWFSSSLSPFQGEKK